MVDLNTLISSDSGIYVYQATNINDRGEITGAGLLPNGDTHAVLLIPCGEGNEGCASEAASAATTRRSDSTLTVAQRLAISKMMAGSRARLRQRYHIPGLAAPSN